MKARFAIALALLFPLGLAVTPGAWAGTVIDVRVVGSVAKIQTLPVGTIGATGSQTGTLSISVKTNWVNTRATVDSPNIVQAGLYKDASQWKLQIAQTARNPHTAQCRIKGSARGTVLADGPAINVADGAWHTIACVKSRDNGNRTSVQVFVDGVGGKVYQVTRIGNVLPTRVPTMGGRTTTAGTDSLDGWVDALSMVTS